MKKTKGKAKLSNHYFMPDDIRLFDYNQIFSISSLWVELGMENIVATYDLSVRGISEHRNFLLFGGLEEMLENIKDWKYTKEEVDFLLKNESITPKMAKLMRNFKFSGDIYAMKEGTAFFSNEPVVRLDGPIWQINLFTFFLINALTSNTIFLSKIVRSVLATQGKFESLSCSVTRAHSNESSLKFGRAAYLLGSPSSLVPTFARKFNLPVSKVSTKAYHAFIKSFPTEIDAMRAATSVFDKLDFMIDTYDVKQGVKNAITVALELKKEGKGRTIGCLVIDSGKDVYDFIRQAKYVRKELDKADLKNIGITLAGNFEEHKMQKLAEHNAPITNVLACTELVTSADYPKLEAVLKLVEMRRGKKITYNAKLAPGKESYPARKQVFRKFKNGKMVGDTIAHEKEKFGTPLLKKVMTKGKLTYKLPNLDSIKNHVDKQLTQLPNRLKVVDKKNRYPVKISPRLEKMMSALRKKHLKT
jgi:nicotinate phosphoribosyltransferase